MADRLVALAARLRELAANATPGPWRWGDAVVRGSNLGWHYGLIGADDRLVVDIERTKDVLPSADNGAFIAALDPSFALLLSELINGIAQDHGPRQYVGGMWTCPRCADLTPYPCPERARWYSICDLMGVE